MSGLEKVWWTVGVVVLAWAITLTSAWIMVEKRVTYLYTAADNQTGTTCVWGYRPWYTDVRYFCSNDIDKVLDVKSKLETKESPNGR